MRALSMLVAGCGRIGFGANTGTDAIAMTDGTTEVTAGLVSRYEAEVITMLSASIFTVPDAIGLHDGRCVFGPDPRECPIAVAGRIGMAYQFDGVDDLVTVASASDLEAGPFTITAWVRQISISAQKRACIATKGFGTGINNSWAICTEPTTGRLFSFSNNLGLTGDALPLDEWHHVAIWWDGAERAIVLDGVIVAGPASLPSLSFDDQTIRIGGEIDGVDRTAAPFPGLIDDLRIYNRALSADELLALANR